MPKMDWGIKSGTVENFDRSRIFVPFKGQDPPTGSTYMWELKKLTLTHAPEGGGYPQLRAGLELLPRSEEEKRYKGYYRSTFSPVSEQTDFRYVPLLDALGVSDREFRNGTMHKPDGTIYQIGRWKFKAGETLLLAQLVTETNNQGKVQAVIKDSWFGTPDEDDLAYINGETDEEEEDGDYDREDDEEDDEDF